MPQGWVLRWKVLCLGGALGLSGCGKTAGLKSDQPGCLWRCVGVASLLQGKGKAWEIEEGAGARFNFVV